MKDTDKNLDYLRQMLNEYEQKPDAKLWSNISKHLSVKHFPYKSVTAFAVVIVAAAVAFWLLQPEEKKTTKNITKVTTKVTETQNSVVTPTTTVSNEQALAVVTPNPPSVMPTPENTEFRIKTDDILKDNININNFFNNVKTNPVQSKIETDVTIPDVEDTNPDNDIEEERINTTQKLVPQLIIPSAFTPSANSNTIFKPAYRELKSYQMQIFNGNGQPLFRSNAIEKGWNGEVNGRLCSEGTYIYIITFETLDGVSSVQKGSVILLR
ncbi:MAG: gliding motility-associated C-terminal domain-containing protein [Bacteroidales bacterium]|jgi:gliding motility-associated-like protein|nr:gliding motility-associated C-terminal domain-containing protein [Bacteroidales bacterium]